MENPIGFGFQDFIELTLAMLLFGSVWASRWLPARLGRSVAVLQVAAAFVGCHFLIAVALPNLRPARRMPNRIERPLAPPSPQVFRPEGVLPPPPVTPQTAAPKKKQVSPFEDVK